MNTELAHEIGAETAKEYRAVGVTMLLGPQIDLIGTPSGTGATPPTATIPPLARDIAAAFIDGLQSTFDENGNDLGWGRGQRHAIAKHYAGAGAAERRAQRTKTTTAKYSVFPGNSFYAHLVPLL